MVWRSGLMAVFNLRPSVCHCTLCCSGRVTAFRASVSVRVQEAAGNAQLRARIHTWKLPSKTPVWSVGHSWVLNTWSRSCLHSPLPQLLSKPVDWTKNLWVKVYISEGSPLHIHCMFVSVLLCANDIIEKNRHSHCPVWRHICFLLLRLFN